MREESSRAHDVFLSYASKDKTWADAACAALERHDIRCWIAPRDITPGDEWGAAIIKGLNSSKIMVLVFSGHANASEQVRREVERAINREMIILPIRLEDVRPEGAMEFALGNRQWLDAFTPPIEQQLELLARSVQTLLTDDVELPDGPRATGDKPAKTKAGIAPTRRPRWMWPSVVVGVFALGLLATWMGGAFKGKTPDGQARGNEDHDSKTETVSSRADVAGGLSSSTVENPARTLPDKPGTGAALAVPLEQTVNSIRMKLVLIPAGEFPMGSPDLDPGGVIHEKRRHLVRISKPFYLGITEVTQDQYRAVTGDIPSNFKGSDDLPVENVSWLDAVEFCNTLSKLENRTPFYRVDGTAVTIVGGNGYRLPTEAEWEYACRAGSKTRYPFGDNAGTLGERAWYANNSDNKTHPVGQKSPNAWGIHDMLGNVWEWCGDWYGQSYYTSSPGSDPPGPASGLLRLYRGGCWNDASENCRSANRRGGAPPVRLSILGFRVARFLSGG
jgi:formylglycine-generating enzyme required for sulfatase activity